MNVDSVVEGVLDDAVARELIEHCNHQFGTSYGKRGWHYIKDMVKGFDIRARHGNPILILVDFMDTGLNCPPEVELACLGLAELAFLHLASARRSRSWPRLKTLLMICLKLRY